MKSLLALFILSLAPNVYADTVTDVMQVVRQVLRAGITLGKAGADCQVVLEDETAKSFPAAKISIVQSSTQKVLVTFELRNQSGTTKTSSTQLFGQIKLKLTQDETGKQTFKFDGKKKILTISSSGQEASCQLP